MTDASVPPPYASRRPTRRRPSGEPPPLPKEITPRRRYLLGLLAGCAVLWLVVLSFRDLGDSLTRAELRFMDLVVDRRTGALTTVAHSFQSAGLHWVIPMVGWLGLAAMAAGRRIRHVVILMSALLLTSTLVLAIRLALYRPRPVGFEIIGEWQGFSHPSGPMARLAVVLVVVTLAAIPRGTWRTAALMVSAAALTMFGLAQVYLGVEHPSDALVGATIGVTVATVMIGLFAPEQSFPIRYRRGRSAHVDVTGPRASAIRHGVRNQLGLEVKAAEPVGLAASAGSTPLRLDVEDPFTHCRTALFAKLYTRSHLRADRWYKLARTLMYGRLENEHSYRSVRHLVEYEDYILRLFDDFGIATARSIGLVELAPEREYLIVTEFLEGGREIGDPALEVTDPMVDSALSAVRQLWDAGLAHRDLKPANVMVCGERVHLVDAAFAQVRPSPWRQAIDLANMMLVLALRRSPQLVYDRARLHFTDDEIAEAFAASRGVTLPSQVRSEIRANGRDLLAEFRALVPPRDPVRIQRFTWRRLLLTASVVAGGLLLTAAFVGNLDELGLI